jgi:hypothetical protein
VSSQACHPRQGYGTASAHSHKKAHIICSASRRVTGCNFQLRQPSNEVAGWKGFFSTVGVKESGKNNDVEMLAMVFVEEKLAGELSNFVPKNRKQFGYDLEARRKQDGALVRLEIKGRKKDLPVELIGNEPQAARNAFNNREPFWVCIVPGIPEDPQLWIVEDALQAGTFDTSKVAQWRTHGRRVP